MIFEEDGPTYRVSGWVHLLISALFAVGAAYTDAEVSAFLAALSAVCLLVWLAD